MVDLRPHVEVSDNFPSSPSYMDVSLGTGETQYHRLRAEADGSLTIVEGMERFGKWWCLSATCVLLEISEKRFYFRYESPTKWLSRDRSSMIRWYKKRDREAKAATGSCRTPQRSGCRSPVSTTPNLSRFRMSILPVDKLDFIHREQLDCLGFRICYHADVGRVLISNRRFESGEVVVYSKVQAISVTTDDDVLNIVDPSHPSCCYLLVPRTKKLYYNQGTFSHEDPVESGDLWYLVNHSNRPNTEVVLRRHGIQLKAKHVIHPYEPITWTYPFGFFGKDDTAVDLPQNILPDDSIKVQEATN